MGDSPVKGKSYRATSSDAFAATDPEQYKVTTAFSIVFLASQCFVHDANPRPAGFDSPQAQARLSHLLDASRSGTVAEASRKARSGEPSNQLSDAGLLLAGRGDATERYRGWVQKESPLQGTLVNGTSSADGNDGAFATSIRTTSDAFQAFLNKASVVELEGRRAVLAPPDFKFYALAGSHRLMASTVVDDARGTPAKERYRWVLVYSPAIVFNSTALNHIVHGSNRARAMNDYAGAQLIKSFWRPDSSSRDGYSHDSAGFAVFLEGMSTDQVQKDAVVLQYFASQADEVGGPLVAAAFRSRDIDSFLALAHSVHKWAKSLYMPGLVRSVVKQFADLSESLESHASTAAPSLSVNAVPYAQMTAASELAKEHDAILKFLGSLTLVVKRPKAWPAPLPDQWSIKLDASGWGDLLEDAMRRDVADRRASNSKMPLLKWKGQSFDLQDRLSLVLSSVDVKAGSWMAVPCPDPADNQKLVGVRLAPFSVHYKYQRQVWETVLNHLVVPLLCAADLKQYSDNRAKGGKKRVNISLKELFELCYGARGVDVYNLVVPPDPWLFLAIQSMNLKGSKVVRLLPRRFIADPVFAPLLNAILQTGEYVSREFPKGANGKPTAEEVEGFWTGDGGLFTSGELPEIEGKDASAQPVDEIVAFMDTKKRAVALRTVLSSLCSTPISDDDVYGLGSAVLAVVKKKLGERYLEPVQPKSKSKPVAVVDTGFVASDSDLSGDSEEEYLVKSKAASGKSGGQGSVSTKANGKKKASSSGKAPPAAASSSKPADKSSDTLTDAPPATVLPPAAARVEDCPSAPAHAPVPAIAVTKPPPSALEGGQRLSSSTEADRGTTAIRVDDGEMDVDLEEDSESEEGEPGAEPNEADGDLEEMDDELVEDDGASQVASSSSRANSTSQPAPPLTPGTVKRKASFEQRRDRLSSLAANSAAQVEDPKDNDLASPAAAVKKRRVEDPIAKTGAAAPTVRPAAPISSRNRVTEPKTGKKKTTS